MDPDVELHVNLIAVLLVVAMMVLLVPRGGCITVFEEKLDLFRPTTRGVVVVGVY